MHYTTEPAQQQAKEVALKHLASLLGIGVAGGVGYRAMTGMTDLFKNHDIEPAPSNNIPYLMPVARMNMTGESTTPHMPKLAEASAPVAAPTAGGDMPDWFKTLASYLPATHTLKPLVNEWGIPAGTAALAAGGYGGYKAVDWLLKKDREQRSMGDLHDAEQQYRDVGHTVAAAPHQLHTRSQYANMLNGDGGLAKLSEAYEQDPETVNLEKQAILPSLLQPYLPKMLSDAYDTVLGGYDNSQAIKGGINTAALAAAVGSGALTYNWAKGQNSQELLRQALARRQAARQQLSPPPIMAIPEDELNAHAAT